MPCSILGTGGELMQRLNFPRKPINQLALHEQLNEVLGDRYVGFSYDHRELFIYLMNDATQADQQLTERLINSHNPAVKSLAEDVREAREERLQATRRNQTPELDLAQYGNEAETVRELAEKVYWLELEIRTLTGQ